MENLVILHIFPLGLTSLLTPDGLYNPSDLHFVYTYSLAAKFSTQPLGHLDSQYSLLAFNNFAFLPYNLSTAVLAFSCSTGHLCRSAVAYRLPRFKAACIAFLAYSFSI